MFFTTVTAPRVEFYSPAGNDLHHRPRNARPRLRESHPRATRHHPRPRDRHRHPLHRVVLNPLSLDGQPDSDASDRNPTNGRQYQYQEYYHLVFRFSISLPSDCPLAGSICANYARKTLCQYPKWRKHQEGQYQFYLVHYILCHSGKERLRDSFHDS